ncbi:MAG: glycosyltransferase family 9 protein [Epsilonproteobacteria bacterium]|nr:glycosyltransferase family 9 protein [Campylobacterota bacterium]
MRILVVRTDKLGDFITALPALYLLKHHDPNNQIIALVAPLNRELAMACEFIDEVIIDDGKSSVMELAKKIKKAHVDASVTLFSNTRVALAQFLACIPKRIAPATKIAQIFYTDRITQRRSEVKMAEFEYNIELAKALFNELKVEYPKPLLSFKDAAALYAKFCQEYNVQREVVAFHVGFGGSSDANWSLDEYVVLIQEVLACEKFTVVLTFGPDEQELCETMRSKLQDKNVIFYISKSGILNFAKLISNFKLFVSTSTGTYHLASLVGCPTMTFFADSLFASSKRWKGVGDEALQQHFMIPHESQRRDALFREVRGVLAHVG